MHNGTLLTKLIVILMGLLVSLSAFAQAEEPLARRMRLQGELDTLEKEIEAQRRILSKKQKESVSLERDVAILDAQMDKAKLAIKARNLTIESLNDDISDKEIKIANLSSKIDRQKLSLSELLRKTSELDDHSISELLLSDERLSSSLIDLDSFNFVEEKLKESLGVVYDTRADTKEAKELLEDRRAEQIELRGIQELEKKRLEEREREKKKLLKETKGKENEYKKILASREKDAARIRTELFQLSGTAAIPFEKAVELSRYAFDKTGIRPAFLLGVIAEESNLGQNVGKGYWKTDMHPTRDQPRFLEITSRLGLNPDLMPVSKKAWYGWGGAMGPAQFIPSTWVLFEDKIRALTGSTVPNPWDPKDAFIAAALLLKDNGARFGDYSSERLAALRYLAGIKNAKKKAYAFYGDDVMALAQRYEQEIKVIGN